MSSCGDNPRETCLGEVNLARGMYLQSLSKFDAFLLMNHGNGGALEEQVQPLLLRNGPGYMGRFRVVTFEWTGGLAPDILKAPHGWFSRVMRSLWRRDERNRAVFGHFRA
jgi:hypothetical protein